MTDTIKDHDLEFSEHESQVAERFLARARKSSAILRLQGSQVGTGWLPGAPDAVDPANDSDITNVPKASQTSTGNDFFDILAQLDNLHRAIGKILDGAAIPKAKPNPKGTTTKPTIFPEKNAGSHNAFSKSEPDPMLVQQKMWENRRTYLETPGEYQARIQAKLASLIAEHRQLRH
jgi:hypothetical protein